MRQGSELIKTGSFMISRTNSRERHRRQTGLQIKQHPSVKAASLNTWVLSHYSVPIRAQQLCSVTFLWHTGNTATQPATFVSSGWFNWPVSVLTIGGANVHQNRRTSYQYEGELMPSKTGSPNRTMYLCSRNIETYLIPALLKKNPSSLLFVCTWGGNSVPSWWICTIFCGAKCKMSPCVLTRSL